MSNSVTPRPAAAHDAFTLIEMLVVISVIAVLAGLTLGVVAGVKKTQYRSTARAEMAVIVTALNSYKAAYGVYPAANNFYSLYYELEGTTSTNSNGVTIYTTLDGSYQAKSTDLGLYAGVQGIVNCTRGTGEDTVTAKPFLTNLRANQVATNNNLAFLVTSVAGPDPAYQPLGLSGVNEWRYNGVNPTNNPTSYDLYIQLVIGGKTNLICNWSSQAQINNPSYP